MWFSLILFVHLINYGISHKGCGGIDQLCNDLDNLSTKWNDRINHVSEQYREVMVAHSGGADSTGLFHFFCHFAKRKKNFSLSLYHMNFGLRGKESVLDESFSRDLAHRFGVPFYVDRISEEQRSLRSGEGIQEWARRLRFEAFKKWGDQGKLIALAHHQGDIAENALFRLSRGSSVGNLAGMEEFSGHLWRPFLHINKAQILAYLEKISETHRVDQSNDKIDYSRNLIRHKILAELEQLYPGSTERISHTAIEAHELSQWCRDQITNAMSAMDEESRLTYLASLPRAVAYEALSLLINSDGLHRQLNRQILEEIYDQIHRDPGTKWSRDLPEGLRITINANKLVICPKTQNIQQTEQHRATTFTYDMHTVIAPNSYTKFNRGNAVWKISNNGEKALHLICHLLQSRDALRFRNGKIKSGKKLLQEWKISAEKKQIMLVVSCGNNTLGVFDGERLVEPDKNGAPTLVSNLLIELTN